jgi:hypothetical protein
LSRSQPGPLSTSKLERVQPAPDVDLIVRRAQRRDTLGALRKSAESEAAPRQKEARVGQLLPAIPKSTEAQDVWLTIPRAQYDQLKKELLGLGFIESESWLSSDKKDPGFRADEQLWIKVTVLPSESGEPLARRSFRPLGKNFRNIFIPPLSNGRTGCEGRLEGGCHEKIQRARSVVGRSHPCGVDAVFFAAISESNGEQRRRSKECFYRAG